MESIPGGGTVPLADLGASDRTRLPKVVVPIASVFLAALIGADSPGSGALAAIAGKVCPTS
jgi:hypothetical protein